MLRLLACLNAIVLCFDCAVHATAQDDDAAARKIAIEVTKRVAVAYLTDRDFKLKGDEIQATAHAIDPQEHVKVEIREFDLLPGRVTGTFKIDTRFAFDGKWKQEEQAADIRGEADLSNLVSFEASFRVDDQGLHFENRIVDIKFNVKIRELRPDDSAEGKAALGKIVAKELHGQREKLVRDFEDWLGKYTRGRIDL